MDRYVWFRVDRVDIYIVWHCFSFDLTCKSLEMLLMWNEFEHKEF